METTPAGSWLLPGVVGFPLLGALVLTGLGRRLSRRAVAWVACVAVGAGWLAAMGSLGVYWGAPQGEGLRFSVLRFWPGSPEAPDAAITIGLMGDGLSLWFALIVTGVGWLIHVYSVGYMAADPGFARYFAELNYFVFAMSLLVLADGLLGMLIGWAGVGLASYLLIGFWHHRPDARAASMKAFIVTLLGELGIVLAVALLWAHTGTLRFTELFQSLGGVPEGTLVVAGLLLLWGAVAKSAQLPLHVWLPDAMAGPTPVSALIHAATMVTAGVYLTARMYPLYQAAPAASAAVAWVGAASALFGALVACGQTDIKRVLAYSTMSQIGYMFLGIGVMAQVAGVFHFFTQAFFKALLFLAAGLAIHHLGGEQDLRRMGGLGARLPLAYGSFAVGVLAMAGFPPFSGYFSKEAVLEAALEHGQVALWGMGAAAAGLTGFYSFRMLALAFTGRPAGASRREAGHHSPDGPAQRRAMEVPVVLLAVLAAVAGWAGASGPDSPAGRILGPFFERYREVDLAAGAAEGVAPGGLGPWAALAAAGIGAAAALYLYGPGRGTATSRRPAPAGVARLWEAGFYVDELYRRVVVTWVVRLSGWLERQVEAGGVDGGVNGVGALAAALSEGLGRLHAGFIRRYALAVLAGATALAAWAVFRVP